MAFLEVAPRTRSLNRKHCTYGWKHTAERWYQTDVAQYEDYYVGEGCFIAACIASGLHIHRGDYGLVVTCVPKVPFWKLRDFNALQQASMINILI
jgi:hypothetical protein